MTDQLPMLRPLPRRPFELTPPSAEPSEPASPAPETTDPNYLDGKANSSAPPSRTRSILNLTSSTLFGIYSQTPYDPSRNEASTPWGTGAQTPSYRPSLDESRPSVGAGGERPQSKRLPSQLHPAHQNVVLALALRTILLFLSGVAYGVIITHLHDDQRLAPVKVGIKRDSWAYLVYWGIAGVGLGSLLPWVDVLWEETLGTTEGIGRSRRMNESSMSSERSGQKGERPSSRIGSGMGADWNPVVRSIGAFVGIAFAIVSLYYPLLMTRFESTSDVALQRRLPWQSTLQVSLTLALANPVLWYLIDRSKPGFVLSTVVGLTGTAVLLGINPGMVPSPATPSPRVNAANVSNGLGFEGMVTNESIGVATWIASVIFCSCVCFGNIGRRLALSKSS